MPRGEEREPTRKTFSELTDGNGPDEFGNVLETMAGGAPATGLAARRRGDERRPPKLFFFCVRQNERLLHDWDVIEDRLYKIRNCLSLEGTRRDLALFQPPIDPGLLVRARAAGLDLTTALADLGAPVPHYRFEVMYRRAADLCREVRALGAAMLAALEKRDAEAVALMRSSQEIEVLTLGVTFG